ncbi:MAG: hypothetical protein HKL95_02135 [Phycisphaerae bacterium]|nr:hypothetical protein [Phycisphaerae bacterium]
MAGKLHLGMVAALVVAGTVGAQRAVATVIVSDTFRGNNGDQIIGRTPDTTNLPGGTWQANGNAYNPTTGKGYTNEIENNQALLGADVGDGIALTGNGVPTETSYTISGTFTLDFSNAASGDFIGAGLGFFSQVSTGNTHGWYDSYGIQVASQSDGSGAEIFLLDSGSNGTTYIYPYLTKLSSFNAAVSHTLSYTVNTVTGDFSNVVLDGSTVVLAATGQTYSPFTPANTALAGILGASSGGNDLTEFSSFSVATSVPDVSALSLLAIGAGVLVLAGRRGVARA